MKKVIAIIVSLIVIAGAVCFAGYNLWGWFKSAQPVVDTTSVVETVAPVTESDAT